MFVKLYCLRSTSTFYFCRHPRIFRNVCHSLIALWPSQGRFSSTSGPYLLLILGPSWQSKALIMGSYASVWITRAISLASARLRRLIFRLPPRVCDASSTVTVWSRYLAVIIIEPRAESSFLEIHHRHCHKGNAL